MHLSCSSRKSLLPSCLHALYTSSIASQDAKANEDANHGDLLGDSTYLQTSFDEVFAFDRTVSRLMEMQSVAYLSEAPGGGRASSSSSSGSGQPGRAGGSQAGHSSSGSNSSSSRHSYNGSVPEAGRDALAAALEQAALVEGLAVEHQVTTLMVGVPIFLGC